MRSWLLTSSASTAATSTLRSAGGSRALRASGSPAAPGKGVGRWSMRSSGASHRDSPSGPRGLVPPSMLSAALIVEGWVAGRGVRRAALRRGRRDHGGRRRKGSTSPSGPTVARRPTTRTTTNDLPGIYLRPRLRRAASHSEPLAMSVCARHTSNSWTARAGGFTRMRWSPSDRQRWFRTTGSAWLDSAWRHCDELHHLRVQRDLARAARVASRSEKEQRHMSENRRDTGNPVLTLSDEIRGLKAQGFGDQWSSPLGKARAHHQREREDLRHHRAGSGARGRDALDDRRPPGRRQRTGPPARGPSSASLRFYEPARRSRSTTATSIQEQTPESRQAGPRPRNRQLEGRRARAGRAPRPGALRVRAVPRERAALRDHHRHGAGGIRLRRGRREDREDGGADAQGRAPAHRPDQRVAGDRADGDHPLRADVRRRDSDGEDARLSDALLHPGRRGLSGLGQARGWIRSAPASPPLWTTPACTAADLDRRSGLSTTTGVPVDTSTGATPLPSFVPFIDGLVELGNANVDLSKVVMVTSPTGLGLHRRAAELARRPDGPPAGFRQAAHPHQHGRTDEHSRRARNSGLPTGANLLIGVRTAVTLEVSQAGERRDRPRLRRARDFCSEATLRADAAAARPTSFYRLHNVEAPTPPA